MILNMTKDLLNRSWNNSSRFNVIATMEAFPVIALFYQSNLAKES
jgi:hypothetical protein